MNDTHGIKERSVVVHFKGKKYCVLHFAEYTEKGEKMVVYQAIYAPFTVYVRPFDMFMSEVDKEKYPDAKQKYRFEVV